MTPKTNGSFGIPPGIPVYQYLGAHPKNHSDGSGSYTFRVYAPNADRVSLCADFCGWEDGIPMKRDDLGIWEVTAENVRVYDCYKYKITRNGQSVYKADPFALHTETPPKTASKIYELPEASFDESPFGKRNYAVGADSKIYKVNLELWSKKSDGNPYSYREAACMLAPFIKQNGYTHIEIDPICEYFEQTSYFGSFTSGLFAPTSRFGTPQDFADMVGYFRNAGIGVILRLPFEEISRCEHGPCRFDGTALLEESDGARLCVGNEFASQLLIACADFWVRRYCIDGIRIMRRTADSSDECFLERLSEYMAGTHPDVFVSACGTE